MSEQVIRLLPTKCAFQRAWLQVVPRITECRIINPVDTLGELEDFDFDVALVSDLHDARIAVDQGKHVCIDAEIDYSNSEIKTLFETSRAKNLCFSIVPLPIHQPGIQEVRDKLFSESLGVPGLMRVHRWSQSVASNFASTVKSMVFGDIHLAISSFGTSPSEMFAVEKQNGSYLQIHLGFPSGGMALLDYSINLPGDQSYESVSLIGSNGAAYADDHHNAQLVFTNERTTARIGDSGDGRLTGIRELLERIRSNERPDQYFELFQKCCEVVDAVYRSALTRQVMHDRERKYEPAT